MQRKTLSNSLVKNKNNYDWAVKFLKHVTMNCTFSNNTVMVKGSKGQIRPRIWSKMQRLLQQQTQYLIDVP